MCKKTYAFTPTFRSYLTLGCFVFINVSGKDSIHMQKLLENIIVFSLIFICSNAIHEFAHLLGCFMFRCRVVDFKVPFFVLFRDGRIRFKFTLKEHNHCSFATSSKSRAFLITLLGPVVDLAIVIALLIFTFNCLFMWGILLACIVIMFFGFYNLLPSINGDGALLYSLCKEK